MIYKRNLKNLKTFRNLLKNNTHLETTEVKSILNWRKRLLKKIKIKTKIININQCKDWYIDNNKNIHHRSGQFFTIKAVKISGASKREVKSWAQPIFTQKHGGILAFISRYTPEKGVEFLLEAKTEPGDGPDIKIASSFQATQSNMNRAHGGRLPNFYDIVVKLKGAKLIYCSAHNEEGARFWKKSNLNVIVQLLNPYDKRIKGENYKWATLTQIKKIALLNNIVNPFVKTILFMI